MESGPGDAKGGAAAALWVPSLDGIRGFVSLSILLVHVQLAVNWIPNHEFPRALRASWFFSIELLFLMGGLRGHAPRRGVRAFPGARRYAVRRAGRLLPLYWVTIALADQLNADPTNWWVPNLRALHDLCEAAGFSRSETVQGPPPATAPVDSMEPGHYRAILHAFP